MKLELPYFFPFLLVFPSSSALSLRQRIWEKRPPGRFTENWLSYWHDNTKAINLNKASGDEKEALRGSTLETWFHKIHFLCRRKETASSEGTALCKCGPLQILWQFDTIVYSISIYLQVFKKVLMLLLNYSLLFSIFLFHFLFNGTLPTFLLFWVVISSLTP